MQSPPDFMTKQEEKQLSQMIETDIGFWKEERYRGCVEGLGEVDVDSEDEPGDLRTVVR